MRTRLYALYALGTLCVVYVLSFMDRMILSILAEDIKADLRITDAQIGFLSGTAFAVFYAVFGLSLGRVADQSNRKNLISVSIAFWSLLTVLSGFARNFASLAVLRFGVGAGEAGSSPAALSMIADYFHPRQRARAQGFYMSGAFVGMGLGVMAGGTIVDLWLSAFPDQEVAPFGLAGWQAAFVMVGAPGLLVSLWAFSLKEPMRGVSEGKIQTLTQSIPRALMSELPSTIPPFSLMSIKDRTERAKALRKNLRFASVIVVLMAVLVLTTQDYAQWVSLAVGVYVFTSWLQVLEARDVVAYSLMFKSKAFVFTLFGFSSISFFVYAMVFWAPTLFLRVHGVPLAEVGIYVGMSTAVGGVIGVNFGSFLADFGRRFTVNARLYVGVTSAVLCMILTWFWVTSDDVEAAYAFYFALAVASTMWPGAGSSTITDIVLPRMRGTAAGIYFLMHTFLGLAISPYLVGKASDFFIGAGETSATALQIGIIAAAFTLIFTCTMLILATKYITRMEEEKFRVAETLDEAGAKREAL